MIATRLLAVLAGAALAARSVVAAAAVLVAVTASPGNALSTGTSAFFAANGTGAAICAGTNAALACPYGTRTKAGVTVAATVSLQAKAATTYRVTVVDGTGPAPISSIVTAFFLSTGTITVTLASGATDTIELDLKLKGATPVGSYTGTLVLTDVATGITAAIPISVTRG